MIDSQLPLIDLHRHLDGNIRLETILDLADQHGITLPGNDVESLRPHVQVIGRAASLVDFLHKFEYLTLVLCDLDACRRVAFENVQDAAREGLAHVELRFSPWFMSLPHKLDPAAVTEAIADGIDAGGVHHRAPDPIAGLTGNPDFAHHYRPERRWTPVTRSCSGCP